MLGPITNLWGPNIFEDPGPMILNFYHCLQHKFKVSSKQSFTQSQSAESMVSDLEI